MSKRSVGWITVRSIKAVIPIPGTQSMDVVLREQGQRTLNLRVTRKNARLLAIMLADYLTLGDLDEIQARFP